VKINRAPVLTLWATVVAERLGYSPDTALTLGRAVAGLNAQSKEKRLGICNPPEVAEGAFQDRPPVKREARIELLGRSVEVQQTEQGLRATAKGEAIQPESVQRYLEKKFGAQLGAVQAAFTELAEAYPPDQLENKAYNLYAAFRPNVPEGVKGWGAAGMLDLEKVRSLAKANK
jgi:hypothetical protein